MSEGWGSLSYQQKWRQTLISKSLFLALTDCEKMKV